MTGAVTSAARANIVLAPVGLILGVLATIVLARSLKPQNFAEYSTVLAIVVWYLILAETGCNLGLMRFLGQARRTAAGYTLYKQLQIRRWLAVLVLGCVLILGGPSWANKTGLPLAHWTPTVFSLIVALTGVLLHGQLAASVLMAEFRQKQLLLTNQTMSVARSLGIVTLAAVIVNPLTIVVVLLTVALIESAILHAQACKVLNGQVGRLETGITNKAQRHGMVALVDKATTAVGGGPFLLLALASSYEAYDLGMLAISTDLLQKALSIVGLPLSNLVLPVLNKHSEDAIMFRTQIIRLGGITISIFAAAAGAIVVMLPIALPLALGKAYEPAVSISLVWLVPLFFESAVRLVWGSALVTLSHYRWLTMINTAFAIVTIAAVIAFKGLPVIYLLMLLGCLRVIGSGTVLYRAAKLGLFPPEARAIGVVLSVAAACTFGYTSQLLQVAAGSPATLIISLLLYIVVLVVMLRWFQLLPLPCHSALCQILGRYEHYFLFLLPRREF